VAIPSKVCTCKHKKHVREFSNIIPKKFATSFPKSLQHHSQKVSKVFQKFSTVSKSFPRFRFHGFQKFSTVSFPRFPVKKESGKARKRTNK